MVTLAVSNSGWPVIGHDRAVARLRQMVAQGQYPPAILVTGPRHVGRKRIALKFAQAALCSHQIDGLPCGVCSSCHRIADIDPPSHPNLRTWSVEQQEYDNPARRRSADDEAGATARAVLTIDSVRKIAGWTAFRPFEGARTIIVVDDAETFFEPAQQAMLKMLEDAPEYVTIILLATSASALLDTVLSRCVEISLQLVPTDVIAAGLGATDAEEIAANAAGRPGWAIKASRDADWYAAQKESFGLIEEWLGKDRPEMLIEAYNRGDSFSRKRRETIEALERLQLIWRDCILVSSGMGQFAFDRQRAERLTARGSAGLAGWLAALTATRRCVQDLTGNIRPRLAMQHMVNQWPTL